MKYRAVIFDLFGTLIYNFSRAEFAEVVAEMAQAAGAPVDEFRETWIATFDERATGRHRTLEDSISGICERLHVPTDPERIRAAAAIRLAYAKRSLRPHPGAVETLVMLRSAGYRLGLITDCTCEVPICWPDTPFAPLIEACVFSCLTGTKKPDRRIYLMACDQLGVPPNQCLYVGDGSSRELSGASEAGLDPVLLDFHYDTEYDSYRIEEEDWQGVRISRLEDVLTLVS